MSALSSVRVAEHRSTRPQCKIAMHEQPRSRNVDKRIVGPLLRLVCVSLLGVGINVFVPNPAHAACNLSGYGPYFNGYYTTPTAQTRGTRAEITIPTSSPSVCSTQSFTDPWVMVADNSSWALAQIGFGIDFLTSTDSPSNPDARRISFAQYTKATAPHDSYTLVFGAPSLGDNVAYRAVYYSSVQKIRMERDGVVMLSTSYDPATQWQTNWHSEWFNELAHRESQSWGTPTVKLLYKDARKYVNGSWETPTSSAMQHLVSNSQDWDSDFITYGDGTMTVRGWQK